MSYVRSIYVLCLRGYYSFFVNRNYLISTEIRYKPCFNEYTGQNRYFMIETLREVFLYNVLVLTKSWVDSLKHYLMIAICYLNLGFNENGRSAKNQVLDAQ